MGYATKVALRLACAAGVAATACKVDPNRPDAAPLADATPEDAGRGGDADVPCPGALSYEVRASDWLTGASLDGVTLTELADPANAATTAAGGRAALCLAAEGGIVLHELPGALPWLSAVAGEVAREVAEAGDAFRAHPLSAFDADEVFVQHLGVPRDPTAAQLVIEVRAYPGGQPLAGARVELAGALAGGVYTGSPGETFTFGDTLDEGELIVFANVQPGPPQAELVITPPAGFQGACSAPAAPVEGGSMNYVLAACTGP
jgi:hypothetical protein